MAIFSNICSTHVQKRLFMNFQCKFRHRRSIPLPRFPVRVQYFSDLTTFSIDFCILYAQCLPYFYFQFDTYWPRRYTTRIDPHVDNSHQAWSRHDHLLPSYSVFVCWYVTWPWPLTFWPWTVVIHGGSRGQPCHQVWRPYAYLFWSYQL